MTGRRQIGLDAVRGIAILLVLLFHLGGPTGRPAFDAALAPFRIAGWTGVELFFVLSGFLVGGIVLRESAAADGFDWGRFMLRRAFRLWPILYLYLGTLALNGAAWDAIWPALVHVQNYASAGHSHLWSLAVEEHFYLAAALALPWLARRASARQLYLTLVAVIVAVNLARVAALALGAPLPEVHWQTQYRIDALAMGVLLAAIRLHRPDWFGAMQRRRAALIALSACGFAILAFDPVVLRNCGADLLVASLAAVPLVIAAADFAPPATAVPAARLLAGLGLIAYPLYIWHVGVARVAAALAASAGITDPLAVTAIAFAAAIGVAFLLHRAIERPFVALRERIGRASRTQHLGELASI